MSDMSDMREMMTLEEASTVLGKSVRTLQRWVADGRLEAEHRDGRTLVAVERPSGAAIAMIQRQADDTGKVAALAAVTGERAAMAYHERAEELERRVAEVRADARWWRGAAVASVALGVASLVTLAATWATASATRDTMADMRERLDMAEAARGRLESVLAGVTRGDTVAADDAPASGVPWSLALVP
jgi:excisionase family DNA binding protein